MTAPGGINAREQDFDSYYAREIEPALVGLEAQRKTRMWLVAGLGALGVAGFGAVALLALLLL